MVDDKENPRDVLAAEEFAMPAPDPRLSTEDARDVLAAEEFAMPAPDPRLKIISQPLRLPSDPKDPTGVEPAHDVLAAEEFAMPAPLTGGRPSHARRMRARRQAGGRALVGIAIGAVMLRRLGRRRIS